MGAYLTQPIKDKEVESGESNDIKYSVAAMQGWRTEMEDAHVAAVGLPKHTNVFGVFDGHGGKEVAKFVALHFTEELQKSELFKKSDMTNALKRTFLGLDELMLLEESQEELVELAADNKDDAEEIEMSDLEEFPDFLREALLASPLSGVRVGGGSRFVANSDLQSFPIEVQHVLEDDDDEEDRGEGATETEGATEGTEVEGTNEETDVVQTNKRRKGDAETSGAQAANGSPKKALRGEQESLLPENEDSATGVRPNANENGEGSGEASEGESPKDAEDKDMGRADFSGPLAGCTAVVALMRGNHLYVANAGDSRCVLSRNGKAIPMSFDHKPTDPSEESRIRKAGGFVTDGRVNGSLNLSRALGDMEYKRSKDLPPEEQMVTGMPDVVDIKLQKGDDFLVLACDGIWDVLDHQESVDFVKVRLEQGMDPEVICQAMCDHCLADDTEGTGEGCDNMTAMVVVLKSYTTLDLSRIKSPSAEGPSANQ
ncbi:hypothetical protein BSKO_03675 [Bryopsis sp. KO-2023]|nr:hypothetical protein BSKO_03675 [Bryopsis sp. KO-2023]